MTIENRIEQVFKVSLKWPMTITLKYCASSSSIIEEQKRELGPRQILMREKMTMKHSAALKAEPRMISS